MDITPILTNLLQLAMTILTVVGTFIVKQYLIPWIKSKLSTSELAIVQEFIRQMIKAAEQMEANGYFDEFEEKSKAKKDYVLRQVKSYCEAHDLTFDKEVISDLIESLIQEVKYPQ